MKRGIPPAAPNESARSSPGQSECSKYSNCPIRGQHLQHITHSTPEVRQVWLWVRSCLEGNWPEVSVSCVFSLIIDPVQVSDRSDISWSSSVSSQLKHFSLHTVSVIICHVTSQTKGKVQLVQIYEQSNFQRLHQRAPWHHTSSTSHQLTVWTRSSMLRPHRQNIQFNLKWWERSNKKSSTKTITQTQSEQTKSNMNQIKSHKFTESIRDNTSLNRFHVSAVKYIKI